MKKKNLKNIKFGRLLVIKEVEPKISDKGRKYSRWECKCDCGNIKITLASNLMRGATKSCGCLASELASARRKNKVPHNKLSKGESGFNILYASYIRGAKNRKLEFTLTKPEFKVLSKGNCYYCGMKPTQIKTGKRSNGVYTYNGIDREDNNEGYHFWNCVSCCKFCNYAKGMTDITDFFKWLDNFAEFVENGKYKKFNEFY